MSPLHLLKRRIAMVRATSQVPIDRSIRACQWLKPPYGLVSLFEIMEVFTAANCCNLFASIGQRTQIASALNPSEIIDKQTLADIWKDVLFPAGYLAGQLGLKASLDMVMSLQDDFKNTDTSRLMHTA